MHSCAFRTFAKDVVCMRATFEYKGERWQISKKLQFRIYMLRLIATALVVVLTTNMGGT